LTTHSVVGFHTIDLAFQLSDRIKMSPLSNLLLAAAVLGLAAAAPTPDHGAAPPGATVTCSAHWGPDFYQVFLDYPDHNVTVPNNRSPTTPNQMFYMVQGVNQKDSRAAVISFSGAPAAAKTCTIGWAQSITGRNLANYGAASLVSVSQLDLGGKALTDVVDKVTLNTIKPLIKPGKGVGSADFGGWGLTALSTPHSTGEVECAEEMAFYVEFYDKVQEGMIITLQDPTAQAGWFMSFTDAC
jgi:hypothetical protein